MCASINVNFPMKNRVIVLQDQVIESAMRSFDFFFCVEIEDCYIYFVPLQHLSYLNDKKV